MKNYAAILMLSSLLLPSVSFAADECEKSAKKSSSATIVFDSLQAHLRKSASEASGYISISITFSDGFQLDLMDAGWSEEQADDYVPEQIYAALGIASALVDHQDRELIVVSLPVEAVADPVAHLKESLLKMFKAPKPIAELDEQAEARALAKRRILDVIADKKSQGRREILDSSFYTKDYAYGKPGVGYCIVKAAKVTKVSGLSNSDLAFISAEPEWKRLATKPNVVILDFSLSGRAFIQLHGDYRIPESLSYGGNSESKLLAIVKSFENAENPVFKWSTRTMSPTGDSERVQVLTTAEVARKVLVKAQELFLTPEYDYKDKLSTP